MGSSTARHLRIPEEFTFFFGKHKSWSHIKARKIRKAVVNGVSSCSSAFKGGISNNVGIHQMCIFSVKRVLGIICFYTCCIFMYPMTNMTLMRHHNDVVRLQVCKALGFCIWCRLHGKLLQTVFLELQQLSHLSKALAEKKLEVQENQSNWLSVKMISHEL